MAIHEVGKGLNCNIVLSKVARCSDRFTVIADAISKADWETLDTLMLGRNMNPCRVPQALLQWINGPKEDLNLGRKILEEMDQFKMVLGYNC